MNLKPEGSDPKLGGQGTPRERIEGFLGAVVDKQDTRSTRRSVGLHGGFWFFWKLSNSLVWGEQAEEQQEEKKALDGRRKSGGAGERGSGWLDGEEKRGAGGGGGGGGRGRMEQEEEDERKMVGN